jgi:hypothetical protein
MVNACPPQSDPRPNVSKFVSDNNTRALAGLVIEGPDGLMKVVVDELKIQEPESNIVIMDRDLMSDEDITFARDFSAYIDRKLTEGKKLNLIIAGDIPVSGWNLTLEQFKGRDLQVYYCAAACRQVPLCTKLMI